MFYMFLADGFEETEALVTLDMMRRAGIDVKTVGISSDMITGAHSITVSTDIKDNAVSQNECEGIILPGGMPGTENLYNSDTVQMLLKFCGDNNKLIAAICAAPVIPGRKNMLKNKNAVCFPGFEDELSGANIASDLCVRDGNIITAKGAGAVFEFSYAIISYICDKGTAESIISTIQHKGID